MITLGVSDAGWLDETEDKEFDDILDIVHNGRLGRHQIHSCIIQIILYKISSSLCPRKHQM